jgi:2-haloacid dehalogenase
MRAVVFDVGDVLVPWDPHGFFATLTSDTARLDRFLGQVATREWHAQHDAGRSFSETSAELVARFPEEAALIRAWGERFVEQIGPSPPAMRAIIADLATAGVPLYAVTNFSAEFWPTFAAREAALLGGFRDILVSGEAGVVKPDPAIYALARARFGLGAGEALFVDDRQENVAGAEDAGFVGHVFTGAAPLRAALEARGLLRAHI